MSFVNWHLLEVSKAAFVNGFNARRPFRFVVIDGFLNTEKAEELLAAFPAKDAPLWKASTYINQRNKQEGHNFEGGSAFTELFSELNSEKMCNYLTSFSGITGITGDETLYGAGLHQSLNGAFLDVHIDFNRHPATKLYRRLNLLIYLNKEWQHDYGGFLELWDMDKHVLLENISPDFNRCVVFETNEESFHGHPVPLHVPDNITRKSVAVYFYSPQPPQVADADSHGTVFKNTQGAKGTVKNLASGLIALKERLSSIFK